MTVDQRLSRLERSCRRWRCTAMGTILVVIGITAAAADKAMEIPDVVQARAFHVVGKQDNVLVKLEDTSGKVFGAAGTITTFNAKGEKLVWITAAEGSSQGMVITLNGAGNKLVQLGSTSGGDGMISTRNDRGKEVVQIGTAKGGTGTVITRNGRGHEVVQITASESGAGVVATLNGKGQNLVKIAASKDGLGMVGVSDPSGKRQRGLLITRHRQ